MAEKILALFRPAQNKRMPTDAGFAVGSPGTSRDAYASDQIKVSWVIADQIVKLYKLCLNCQYFSKVKAKEAAAGLLPGLSKRRQKQCIPPSAIIKKVFIPQPFAFILSTMATWIAHLRIAENLLSRIPDLDDAQFAIGNIAPDSGIPDENWEKFTPPPSVTHFKRSDSVHKDLADLDFYRGYLADINPRDMKRFSFRLGYFFHLITDNLWTIHVGKPTQDRYPEQFAADKKFIWEVKKDWYGLDHIHVREHPGCLFWRVFLKAEPDSAELDFLPPQALSHQLQYIKDYYQRRDDEIDAMCARPFAYLPRSDMDMFIDNASHRLYKIYQLLWPVSPHLGNIETALELFNE